MAIDITIPRDKQLHFAAGAIAAAVGAIFASVMTGLVLAIVAGGLKELADYVHNWWLARSGKPPAHDVDKYDAAFTVAGGAAVALGITIVKAVMQ